jgi:hypothetical protein
MADTFNPVMHNNRDNSVAGSLEDAFWQSHGLVKNRGIIFYPNGKFERVGIPSLRQYFAFDRLINLIGPENFDALPRIPVDLDKDEIPLKDQFGRLFDDPSKKLTITFTSGHFWAKKLSRRAKMIQFLTKELASKGFSVTIYTQDKNVEDEIKNSFRENNIPEEFHNNVRVVRVSYRIDIHYIIIDEPGHPEGSYIFIEFPHTEKYSFRLDTYFSFDTVSNKFACTLPELLNFLDKLKNRHIFRSVLSFFNCAIKS